MLHHVLSFELYAARTLLHTVPSATSSVSQGLSIVCQLLFDELLSHVLRFLCDLSNSVSRLPSCARYCVRLLVFCKFIWDLSCVSKFPVPSYVPIVLSSIIWPITTLTLHVYSMCPTDIELRSWGKKLEINRSRTGTSKILSVSWPFKYSYCKCKFV